jgi:hypothetical protein
MQKPFNAFVYSTKNFFLAGVLGILLISCQSIAAQDSILQIIFTSDLHYGLYKNNFKNNLNVSAEAVNKTMALQMNKLAGTVLPNDHGVQANKPLNAFNALIITGDIANRQEDRIQTATDSWKQFNQSFVQQLNLFNNNKEKTPLYITPGNHDISNAIGHFKPMFPRKDNTIMVELYNSMLLPSTKKTSETYNYATDKIHYSSTINGIHFVFINLWPDAVERAWMEQDLAATDPSLPVLIFTHATPDVESKFFINPNGDHSINAVDQFENLLSDTFKDGSNNNSKSLIEQSEFEAFIKKHPSIKAYFHGHSNYAQFYNWEGPNKSIQLPCFRSDSPMKGKFSADDETKLSFQLISINTHSKQLTVRECLWNTEPSLTNAPIVWGQTKTISLQ